MTQPAELLELATAIAVEAGELVRRRRAEGVEVAESKSSITDVVTFADRESEDLIRARIAEARPDDGFLGEEGGAAGGTSGITWVVDPIDGTVNYLYDIPFYAVSIAVVQGEPDPATWTALAGVVVNPSIGEVYTAARGEGAYLGERRLHVPPAPPLGQALVATGFSYEAEKRGDQAHRFANLMTRVRDLRRLGAASLDLCAVASGRLDAYFERGLKPWDHGAGVLIAQEAGASVTGLEGRRAGDQFTLATHAELAAELEREIIAAGI
ncbi:inositol monophosphatase family protein [Herbiconiux sp. SYSU D00978]|uniref:inositol monophosphatase family protein n=1 Tax=Herbiconiux sp. SYSU D00978 TaxID=2812562 RepID=UPI001A96778C|nr:inositol monophosphatase family protein [Herbiconiux sp. SYSU D00978]